MAKTTVKAKLKDKKTGEETKFLAISKSLDNTSVDTKPQTTDEILEAEALEEMEAAEEVETVMGTFKIQETGDEMTKFLKSKHKLAYLRPDFRYSDSRWPKDDNGRTMNVSRFYAPLNLCVDNIPENRTKEMIVAKKWGIEKAGFNYIWKQDGEVVKVDGNKMFLVEMGENAKGEAVEKTEDFWKRQEKIKDEPTFKFNMKPFSFTMAPGFGGLHA